MGKAAKGPRGQTKYDPAVVDEIIERVSRGETLRAVCRSDPKRFPPEATFRLWVVKDYNGLSAHYARAREAQAEAWADEIVEVADEGGRDTTTNERGDAVCDHEWISRSRLKVDTRKWLMAKLHPRQYGEKIEQKVTADLTHKADDSLIKFLFELRATRGD